MMSEELYEELRKSALNDIKDKVREIDYFRKYESRHYYEVGWPSMVDIIKGLDKEMRMLVRGYEAKYGRKITKEAIRRVFEI